MSRHPDKIMSEELQPEEIRDIEKAMESLNGRGCSATPCSRLSDYHAKCTKEYGKTPTPYQAGVKTGLEAAMSFVMGTKVCPWCGGKWRVEWEPVKPICDGETNRSWFIECEHCMAQGPVCYTEADARKYLPENSDIRGPR